MLEDMQRDAFFARTCFRAAHRIRAFISASDRTTGNHSQFVVGCGVHNGLHSIDRHVFGFTRCLSVSLPLHHTESRWVCGVVFDTDYGLFSVPQGTFSTRHNFLLLFAVCQIHHCSLHASTESFTRLENGGIYRQDWPRHCTAMCRLLRCAQRSLPISGYSSPA